jgi:hypothetical protein
MDARRVRASSRADSAAVVRSSRVRRRARVLGGRGCVVFVFVFGFGAVGALGEGVEVEAAALGDSDAAGTGPSTPAAGGTGISLALAPVPELVGLSSPSFPPSLLGFVSAAVVAAPEVEAADNVAATAPKVPNKRSTRSARRFCAASSSRRASMSPKAPARRAARWAEVVRVPGRGVVVVVGKVEEEEVGKVEAEEEAGSVDEDVAVEGAASLAALSTTARTTAGMGTSSVFSLDSLDSVDAIEALSTPGMGAGSLIV